MTTTTSSAATATGPSPSFPRPPDPATAADTGAVVDDPAGSFGRIVAGSLLAGVVVAAVLTLVVFAGAEEAVVTGAALLAFAFGWSLLGLLSTRRTTRPQRWAYVPAGAFAATGLALVALTPGDGALTAAGWVWPPALLVLAAWTGTRIRRDLRGRSRWLLYPVVLVLAAAAVGGAFETTALVRDGDRFAMPGRAVDIGGRRLHLDCTGTGAPTVVFSNGLGETSALWHRFLDDPALAGTRRCAYDRAGQGWSDDAPAPADSLAVAADLHALLDAAGEHGPFVLVGHSAGGPYAMTFAAQHPGDVAGLVLLDASSPRQFDVIPSFPGTYRMGRRLYGIVPGITRTGLLRLAPASAYSTLPGEAGGAVRAFASSPRDQRTARDEHSRYREAFPQALALESLDDKPLVVVTATEGAAGGWDEAQDELARLSTNARHDRAATDHVGVVDDPGALATSVAAIADVVESARTGAPLRSR
jgi:pimeloyl-ACP methyl ester carboxylesterase